MKKISGDFRSRYQTVDGNSHAIGGSFTTYPVGAEGLPEPEYDRVFLKIVSIEEGSGFHEAPRYREQQLRNFGGRWQIGRYDKNGSFKEEQKNKFLLWVKDVVVNTYDTSVNK